MFHQLYLDRLVRRPAVNLVAASHLQVGTAECVSMWGQSSCKNHKGQGFKVEK